MTALATTLQAFFTDRLARQRQVSPNTLAAYRDTLRLLLVFAANKKDKEPSPRCLMGKSAIVPVFCARKIDGGPRVS